jgi:hypothetical protein
MPKYMHFGQNITIYTPTKTESHLLQTEILIEFRLFPNPLIFLEIQLNLA